MTPEELKQFKALEKRIIDLEYKFNKDNFIGEKIFDKKITFLSDVDMKGVRVLNGRTLGTYLGFYGVDPVVQQDAITAPSGGETTDSQARAAISSVLTVLRDYGLIKSS